MSTPSVFHFKNFMTMEHFVPSEKDNTKVEIDIEKSNVHNVFFKHNHYTSSKWEQYLSIYNRLFAPFILNGKPIHLMELGIQNGGSLEIWQKLFPQKSHFVGVDIDKNCKKLEYNEYIEIFIGDISKGELLNDALKNRKFDIIIDDASHFCQHVWSNFNNTFEMLSPGGLYIIEDCHTSYWQKYGGGLNVSGSIMENFKIFIDIIHYYYFKDFVPLSAETKKFCEKYHPQIASISFYDSIIVIEKYLSHKDKPFRNYLFGKEGLVVANETQLNGGHLEVTETTQFEKHFKY